MYKWRRGVEITDMVTKLLNIAVIHRFEPFAIGH